MSGRWFLTAGHCVSGGPDGNTVLPASAFTANLGESDVTQYTAAERFTLDRAPLRHEAYSSNDGAPAFDLALLHLAAATPAEPRFEPMRIVGSGETELWAPGVVATIIGWGQTESGAPSAQLRQAGVAMVSDSACASAWGAFFLTATMVCAGRDTTDTCLGDSGGPLLVPRVDTFALAGVTSWGHVPCADPAFPGVYARAGVAPLNAWIRGRIPTVSLSFDAQSPNPGDNVILGATTSQGPQPAAPTARRWDLDDDGAFDDASGPTATLTNIASGSHGVRVQETYSDGDRAIAREVITTAGSPPPQPPPPPPPPPKPLAAVVAEPAADPPVAAAPPAPPPGAPADAPVARSPLPPLARLLPDIRRVRVRSLLDGRTSIRVACSVGCTLHATLTLDARAAAHLRLARSADGALIGSGERRLTAAGSARLPIRLTRKAVRALRGARGGRLDVRVTAAAGARTQQLDRALTLRR